MKNVLLIIICVLTLPFGRAKATTNIVNMSRPNVLVRSSAPDLTIRMGQGFNALGGLRSSQGLAYCVGKTALETFGGSSGETLSIYVDSISSSEELSSMMTKAQDFSVGATLSGGVANTVEKMNPLSTNAQTVAKNSLIRKYDAKYNYVYVQIRKEFETELLSQFEVPAATVEYFSARPNEFFSKCGDRFVSGVKKGAEVIGVLRCEARSSEEKANVDRMIKASAGYKGLTAQGEVKDLLESIKKATTDNCNMIVASQGGNSTYALGDSASFITSAINYAASATLASAKPLEFVTTPYEAIISKEFSANVLDKIDLKLKQQRAFVNGKKAEMDFYFSTLDVLSQENAFDDEAARTAASALVMLSAQIEKCAADALNPAACRDIARPGFPSSINLKPSTH